MTFQAAFTLYRITFDPIQKCSFSIAFTLNRITFHPIQKCSFSLAFTLYQITFDPIQRYSFSLAFTLYQITFDPILKCSFPSRLHCTGSLLIRHKKNCSFSLAFTLYRYSFGAVQVQNCSSFLVGTKLYPIADTKLYRITLSSINARLIRNTFVSDQKWSGTVSTQPH